MLSLSQHFHRGRGYDHAEQLRLLHRQNDQRADRERKDRLDAQDSEDLLFAAIEVISATAEQVRAFELKLDRYDEATVSALLRNEHDLELVNERLNALLERAHVLSDGRRVFRTADGSRVFDEFGVEVSPDELDFDEIPEDGPTWEEYEREMNKRKSLLTERRELLDYQEELDKAREGLSDGEISQEELEELDADLETLMPEAVKRELAQYGSPATELGEAAPGERLAETASDQQNSLAGHRPGLDLSSM